MTAQTTRLETSPQETRRDTDAPWHSRPTDAVLAALDAGPEGLTPKEAARRLARVGPNRLPETTRAGPVARFLRQFRNLLIFVLIGAAAVTALLGHVVDTGVILAVVLVNAIIGFVQEGRAERALSAIKEMLAPEARVLRDGRRSKRDAEALVPGDIVLLEAGDRVPADLRLLSARGLRLQEAVLTGESAAVEKTADTAPTDAPLGDRHGMAFSGALVAAGSGRGVVVATGAATEIGRISGMLDTVETVTTPLLKQMDRFARMVTLAILVVASLILGFGILASDMTFAELFMAVVGLSVAAIPEGLPAILTVTMAIGVQGMAARRAIVRRLPAIEALGSVSVICSDKTGTLTRNEMTVASVATARHVFAVTGTGYGPQGGITREGREIDLDAHPLMAQLAEGAILCNEADVAETDGHWTVTGDPMEGALLAFGMKAGRDPEAVRQANPQTDTIPFDAQHRFMATLHQDRDGAAVIHVKGAPEQIIGMCAAQDGANGEEPLDSDYWHACAEAIAARGQRVLAIATKRAPNGALALAFDDVETGLTLRGLVGMIDPPREAAVAAVADCRAAGIRVKMITGDHAGTAAAIARDLGLENPEAVLTGADLDALDADALRDAAQQTDIFARTSPEHKLRLVQALQAGGAAVAMTGDGVNDAPALKRADIGVAMGRTGTEVAKEAAEIVLADDNFATIAEAVKEGRTVYDNLKKVIAWTLPTNAGEALAIVVALLAGIALPISAVQILWINLVTAVTLGLALAFEGPEPDIMRRPPRRADEPILSGFLLWRVGFVSVLFCAGIFGTFTLAQAQGASLEEARTTAVNALVVMEVFYLFSVRFLSTSALTVQAALGTRPVLIAVGAIVILQTLLTYAPLMQALFDTRPLTIEQAATALAVGPALLLILEIEKRLRPGGNVASSKSRAATRGRSTS